MHNNISWGFLHEVLLDNDSMTEIRIIVSFAERYSCLTIHYEDAQVVSGQALAITCASVFSEFEPKSVFTRIAIGSML